MLFNLFVIDCKELELVYDVVYWKFINVEMLLGMIGLVKIL